MEEENSVIYHLNVLITHTYSRSDAVSTVQSNDFKRGPSAEKDVSFYSQSKAHSALQSGK